MARIKYDGYIVNLMVFLIILSLSSCQKFYNMEVEFDKRGNIEIFFLDDFISFFPHRMQEFCYDSIHIYTFGRVGSNKLFRKDFETGYELCVESIKIKKIDSYWDFYGEKIYPSDLSKFEIYVSVSGGQGSTGKMHYHPKTGLKADRGR